MGLMVMTPKRRLRRSVFASLFKLIVCTSNVLTKLAIHTQSLSHIPGNHIVMGIAAATHGHDVARRALTAGAEANVLECVPAPADIHVS